MLSIALKSVYVNMRVNVNMNHAYQPITLAKEPCRAALEDL